jgi:O-antigen/teichoic acid export membrane protein
MNKASLVKNTAYSVILQISSLILSLITSPYLSKILGATQLGRVNFINSIASWFTVFSVFGVSVYGVRAVAKARNDKEQLSKVFSELILIRLIFTAVSLGLFIASLFLIQQINREFELVVLQCIVLILNIFSIDWLFQGVENYRYIYVRSLIYKLISAAAVFVFIKRQDDILVYALILAASNTLSNLLNVFYVRKEVKMTVKGLNFKRHFAPLVYFFITAFLLNVYMMIDQTFLGFMKTDKDVALLARARVFLNMAMVLPSSINAALMPRLILLHQNDKDAYAKLLRFSANAMMLLAVPLSVGMIFVSKYLLVLVGSGEFLESETALIILSASVITVSMGGFNYSQRIVPNGKEKVGIVVCLTTAVINLGLNLALINRWGIVGCAISYLAAEWIGNAVWFVYMNKIDRFKIFFKKDNIRYFLGGIVMGGCLFLLQMLLPSIRWRNFILSVAVGAAAYFAILLILKDDVLLFGWEKTVAIVRSLKEKCNKRNQKK